MRFSQTSIKWIVLVFCIVFVCAIVMVLTTHKGTNSTVITQTGGSYFPHSTWVVFYNADNLYGNVSNSDIETLRNQLDNYLLGAYGPGNYRARVVNGMLNVTSTSPNTPPAFWFLLKIDGKPGTVRVDADTSSGQTAFTLTPQAG